MTTEVLTAVITVLIPAIAVPIVGFVIWFIKSRVEKQTKILDDKRALQIHRLEIQLNDFLWPLFFRIQRHKQLISRFLAIQAGRVSDSTQSTNQEDKVPSKNGSSENSSDPKKAPLSMDDSQIMGYFDDYDESQIIIDHDVNASTEHPYLSDEDIETALNPVVAPPTTVPTTAPMTVDAPSEAQPASSVIPEPKEDVTHREELLTALRRVKEYLHIQDAIDQHIRGNLGKMRNIIYSKITIMELNPVGQLAKEIYRLDKFITLYESFRVSGDKTSIPSEIHRAAYPPDLEQMIKDLLNQKQRTYAYLIGLRVA